MCFPAESSDVLLAVHRIRHQRDRAHNSIRIGDQCVALDGAVRDGFNQPTAKCGSCLATGSDVGAGGNDLEICGRAVVLQQRAAEAGQWIESSIRIQAESCDLSRSGAAADREIVTIGATGIVVNRSETGRHCFNFSKSGVADGEVGGLRAGQAENHIAKIGREISRRTLAGSDQRAYGSSIQSCGDGSRTYARRRGQRGGVSAVAIVRRAADRAGAGSGKDYCRAAGCFIDVVGIARLHGDHLRAATVRGEGRRGRTDNGIGSADRSRTATNQWNCDFINIARVRAGGRKCDGVVCVVVERDGNNERRPIRPRAGRHKGDGLSHAVDDEIARSRRSHAKGVTNRKIFHSSAVSGNAAQSQGAGIGHHVDEAGAMET